MSSTEINVKTLYRTSSFWALLKPPKIHFDELLSGQNSKDYVPVHRLDFETSGVILYASEAYLGSYQELFKTSEDKIKKKYLLACENSFDVELPAQVEGFVGARYRSSKKTKFSEFKEEMRGFRSIRRAFHIVEKANSSDMPWSLPDSAHCYQIELKTGARHQIRAYCKYLEAPILGDPVYGSQKKDEFLKLYAKSLEFICPNDGQNYLITA